MRRVLLVDDNSVETSRLRAEMLRLNYDIVCAAHGAAGILTAREFRPEVVLLNPILPDMNGYDFCRKLREQKETAHVPILLIVRSSIPQTQEGGVDLTTDKYPTHADDIKALQEKLVAGLKIKTHLDKRIYLQNEKETHWYNAKLLSGTDSLTGLLNGNYLQDILLQEFLRAQRYGTLFSIIMIDVDGFKNVNDALGHDIGDQVLHEFSVVIRSQMREVDILSRYGGDVFAALLPQSSADMAMIVAKRISEGVRVHIFHRLRKSEGWEGKPLTVSMGVCGLPNPHISQSIQVISGADLALLRAKKMGGNRIEVATEQDIGLISTDTR